MAADWAKMLDDEILATAFGPANERMGQCILAFVDFFFDDLGKIGNICLGYRMRSLFRCWQRMAMQLFLDNI
jgi:hypothetical protein